MYSRQPAGALPESHIRIKTLDEKKIPRMVPKQSMYCARYLLARRELNLFPKDKTPIRPKPQNERHISPSRCPSPYRPSKKQRVPSPRSSAFVQSPECWLRRLPSCSNSFQHKVLRTASGSRSHRLVCVWTSLCLQWAPRHLLSAPWCHPSASRLRSPWWLRRLNSEKPVYSEGETGWARAEGALQAAASPSGYRMRAGIA